MAWANDIGYPLILKPRSEGSSVALSKVYSEEELYTLLDDAFTLYDEMLLQECIIGREFTVGMVEYDGKLQALPPTEIILTRGSLFDYEAKYTPE